jgi:glycerol transport system permease protein
MPFRATGFVGDKHLFFWLLTNRMAPAAVFALPFFQLYSAVGLFDTHLAVALAHCLFNVPLAVWILEGLHARRAEGDRRDRLYRRLLVPALLRQDLHAAIASGIGVAAFFCFMFSWVELLLSAR